MEQNKKLPDFSNRFFWIALSVLIKALVLSFFLWESYRLTPQSVSGGIVIMQNDYYMFLHPVDTYLKTGFFTLDGVKPFAGRMPGYSAPYFLLRMVLDHQPALVMLILLQILLSAISVYTLARLAQALFKQNDYFLLVFFVGAISTYTSIFDIFTLSESFAVSALVFCLYYLYHSFYSGKKLQLFWAGFFLAWLIFLRPFIGLLILIVPLIVFFRDLKKSTFKMAFINVCILSISFSVMETAWLTRNYLTLHKFIPLETSLDESYGKYGAYRSSAIAIRQLITVWGGETGEFYDHSEASWFHNATGDEIAAYEFSPRVFKANFTKDSLIELKKIFNESGSPTLPDGVKDSLNTRAEQIATRYKNEYEAANKARVLLINPFIRIQKLVFSNPNMSLPLPKFQEMNIFERGIKLSYIALYFLIVMGGFVGALWMLFRKDYDWFWLALIAVPFAIIITIVFNPLAIIANRYFLCAYPVLILFTMYFVSLIKKRKAYDDL